MPPCTIENEPDKIFNEDLFQSTSFIDLLEDSPDVNMSCYMSDEEPPGIPPMVSSSSEFFPTGDSFSVLDMINQDLMFGSLQSAASNASTEVTYSTQSLAFSTAPFTSAGDVFLPSTPITTVSNTFVKPYNAYVTTASSSHTMTQNPKPGCRPKPPISKAKNPFAVNPFILTETPSVKDPLQGTRVMPEKKISTAETDSRKKSKCKSRSRRSSSYSRTKKKSSRTTSKKKNIVLIDSPQKSVPPSTSSDVVQSAVTHTVTRTTNIVTESSVVSTTETIRQKTSVGQIFDLRTGTFSKNAAMATCKGSSVIHPVGPLVPIQCTKSLPTSHTVTRTRTPRSIISPVQNTYCLPTNASYSTPTIVSRTIPAASGLAADKVCEKFTILPAQSGFDPTKSETEMAPLTRSRLVIPGSLNPYAATVDTTSASTAHTHRVVHAVRPGQNLHFASNLPSHVVSATTNTSTAMSRALTHSSFALPPGATLYTARKLTKPSSQAAAATEPHMFAIVDGKGTYTTLTISSDFTTTTTGSPLVMTQTQNMTTVTTGASITSPGVSDSVGRPRSQLIIPLANRQMNITTSVTTTATSITSHTITTISSEALNRIRNRLLYNVPSTAAGASLPPSTVSPDGNRPRGPLTIVANPLISGVSPREAAARSGPSVAAAPRAIFSAASTGFITITTPITSTISSTNPAEPACRSASRVVIPLNVHATSTTQSSVSTQGGAYIVADMNPSPSTTAREVATRSSRVVIPFIHNTSAGAAPTCTPAVPTAARACPAAACSSIASTDALSKLRNRLTIQVGTTESSMPGTTTPITAYTITRTRAPQSVHTIPAGSAPYRPPSTKACEGSSNPAKMTLITFSPPSAGGAPAACALRRSPSVTRIDTPSPALTSTTSATPTLASTGNRFVIKLASSQSAVSGGCASSVTASITTPITSTALSPTARRFTAPPSMSARPRTFPGPRTYSTTQRSPTGNTALRPVPRHFNPRVQKAIPNPAPLQIFADVVCPPTTAPTQTTTTRSNSKSQYTLSHSPGSSTLIVPQNKNTVFKNVTTIAQPDSGRNSSRSTGPRASSEGLVLSRSVALVSSRRPAPAAAAGRSTRETRSRHAGSTAPVSRASPTAADDSQASTSHSSPNKDDQNN